MPGVVDLAAMRDAIVALGGDRRADQSAVARRAGHRSLGAGGRIRQPEALAHNNRIEFERNRERYAFLRWGQNAFDNFKVVPPNTGIVHQVNIEYLARVVFDTSSDGTHHAYPDTLVGTDSHTTMVNGLGVLGWGVGGIEAEAAMLGQPVTMLIPQVIGFKLTGKLPRAPPPPIWCSPSPRCCASQRGRQVRRVLRRRPRQPAAGRPRHHRQHVAGVRQHLRHLSRSTTETMRYLELSGRSKRTSRWSRAMRSVRACGARTAAAREYTDVLELDLARWSRRWPDRAARRIACRWRRQGAPSSRAWSPCTRLAPAARSRASLEGEGGTPRSGPRAAALPRCAWTATTSPSLMARC